MTKTCNKCNIEKGISCFGKHGSTRDKRKNQCQECVNEKQRAYRAKTDNKCTATYEKTHRGFIMRMYRNMKSRITGVQKLKQHLYSGKDILPKEEFYQWALSNNDFITLFENYKNSGYKMKLAPSIDRIDSKLGYEISNMQFITHSENSSRGAISKKMQRCCKDKFG